MGQSVTRGLIDLFVCHNPKFRNPHRVLNKKMKMNKKDENEGKKDVTLKDLRPLMLCYFFITIVGTITYN